METVIGSGAAGVVIRMEDSNGMAETGFDSDKCLCSGSKGSGGVIKIDRYGIVCGSVNIQRWRRRRGRRERAAE